MYKDNLLKMFKHKLSGEYVRLIILRPSNVNTFIQVDCNNIPIIIKRCWSVHPTSQRYLIKGFKNIKEC